LTLPSAVSAISSSLVYGPVDTSGTSSLNLHGLNSSSTNLPSNLTGFAPFLYWQDQGNSYCPAGVGTGSCTTAPSNALAPQMSLAASSNAFMYGALYQPRGAWMIITGSSTAVSPIQIVTGAVDLQGSGSLLLTSPTNPITTLTSAMVE
jgi:hypothetical protein